MKHDDQNSGNSNQAARSSERGPNWNRSESRAKRMNRAKWFNLVVLATMSSFIALQHQNCAPAPNSAVTQAELGSISEDPMPVSVINDVKSGATLSFQQKLVEIHSETEAVVLKGQCPTGQEGAILGWKVKDEVSGQELERGFAKCEAGEFNVELAPTQELNCDQSYRVTAQLGFGQKGEVQISRRCAPDAVEAAPGMKAQLAPDAAVSCVVEKREGHGSGCSAVCYNDDGVVESEQELAASACGL